ncbi:MAG TPA: FtsX-like permease family protein [Longimicrobiaceae bacterium]|nr:FtsX-like permease family protein [Longimicrobiaceae bacterium]
MKRLVLGEGLRLAGIGVAVGAVLALLSSSLLESFVFGVSACDPYTFGAVTLVILGAAMLASWVPARRASSSDPLALLRSE